MIFAENLRPPTMPSRRRGAFKQPVDSDRGHTFLGRLSDCLTGKGPDMFIGSYYGYKGPRPEVWARYPDLLYPRDLTLYGDPTLDNPVLGLDATGWRKTMPWARRTRKRYNPTTRRYEEFSYVPLCDEYGRLERNVFNEPWGWKAAPRGILHGKRSTNEWNVDVNKPWKRFEASWATGAQDSSLHRGGLGIEPRPFTYYY